MHYCYVHTIHTHLWYVLVLKGIVKYLIASHRGRRVFNTSLLSSTELPCTLMRSASVLPVSYQVLPEESILCQCFVGSESETSDAASGSSTHRTNPHRFSGKCYHPWLKLPFRLRSESLPQVSHYGSSIMPLPSQRTSVTARGPSCL